MATKEKKKIQPTIVNEPSKELLQPNFLGFDAHPGEYHMVKLDGKGEEIPGSDVSIPEKLYIKTYSKLDYYKVKKNPKK